MTNNNHTQPRRNLTVTTTTAATHIANDSNLVLFDRAGAVLAYVPDSTSPERLEWVAALVRAMVEHPSWSRRGDAREEHFLAAAMNTEMGHHADRERHSEYWAPWLEHHADDSFRVGYNAGFRDGWDAGRVAAVEADV